MYDWSDARSFAQSNAVGAALGEVAASGALYVAARSGALQPDAEVITGVRYNADGSLYTPPAGGVWLVGSAVGSRPVSVALIAEGE